MLNREQLRRNATRDMVGRYAVFLVSAGLFCVFYRDLIASGFDRIPGDDGDSLLNLHVLEHWRQWLFRGHGAWLSLSNFFPLTNTLGYTDSMFLFGVVFGVIRSLSIDLLTAYQCTLLVVHIAGYAAFYRLLRSVFSLRRMPALAGASLATLNNAFFVSIGHTQLFAIGLVPLAWWLVAEFLRFANGPTRVRRWVGSGLAILLPLMLYTGYYVTWFLIFFGVLTSIVYLVVNRLSQRDTAAVKAAHWLRRNQVEMLAYMMLALYSLAPFLFTYLPILHEIGGRPFEEARATLPRWFDFFNIGTANVMWGSLFTSAFPEASSRPLAWELSKGASPLMFVLFLFSAAWGVRTLWLSNNNKPNRTNLILPMTAAVLGISVVAGWLLQLRVGDYSSWWLVYKFIPGASAIRAAFRFQHILLFGVAAVIAVGLQAALDRVNSFAPRSRAGAYRVLLIAGTALLLAEQLNSGDFSQVRKESLRAELASVKTPPADCRVFFVTPPDKHTRPAYGLNTRAMLMAYQAGIPTLNGYTSGPPPGWGLSDVYASDYISRVVAWLNLHQIHDGICSLSMETWQWSSFDVAHAPQPVQLDGALPDSAYLVRLEMLDPPKTMRAGEQRAVSIRVVNSGTAALSALGKYPVRISYQWTDAKAQTDGFNYRKDLTGSLKPGESMVMTAELQAPANPGQYQLDVDLVQELIAWFRNKGGMTYSTSISILDK